MGRPNFQFEKRKKELAKKKKKEEKRLRKLAKKNPELEDGEELSDEEVVEGSEGEPKETDS